MTIAFFTEGNYTGQVSRSSAGRTDQAWISALNADHYPIGSNPSKTYDLGIIIPPKRFDGHFTDIFDWVHKWCKDVACMQEGDSRLFWQDRPIWQQIDYLNFLQKCHIIYCHNEIDQKYYRGLISNSDIRILPTLMIDDAVPINRLTPVQDRSGTMINGNWCSWYGGADSFFIAQEIGQPISAPQMGRMHTDELEIDQIRHLPYTNWAEWMVYLSDCKYAVNLMRTIAAASFSLNCAWLSIPCVGWDVQDTQRLCFPELSVQLGDMESARKVAKHLATNDLFYRHCAAYAKKIATDIYSEERFLENFYSEFQGQ